MKKRILLVMAGAIVCLSMGCAKYTHPTYESDRVDNDYAMCVTKADYQVDFHPYSTDAAHPYESKLMTYSDRYWGIIRTCMESKGYTYQEEETWLDSFKKSVQN